MVDPRNKKKPVQGQSSSKDLIPLSDLLDFNIHWPDEIDKSVCLTGVDPIKFLPKLDTDVSSDPSIKQPAEHKFGVDDEKNVEVETPDHQNLFENRQSAESVDNFSQLEASVDDSEWEADFQFADSQNQEKDLSTSENFADFSNGSGNPFPAAKPVDVPIASEVDLSAQIDSVFGPGKDFGSGISIENPANYPAFDDDLWNNFGSMNPQSGGELDAVDSAMGNHKDRTLESSRDLSTSADFLQDFPLQPNVADEAMNNTMNDERLATNLDSFEEWDDFTSFSSGQKPLQTGPEFQLSTSEQKSPEIDLFTFDSKYEEGDFGNFPQPDLLSPTNTKSDSLTEISSIMPENSASISSYSNPSDPSHISTNNGDPIQKSTRDDDVKMLLSQMHDLSFMLETDLSIPAASDTRDSYLKD